MNLRRVFNNKMRIARLVESIHLNENFYKYCDCKAKIVNLHPSFDQPGFQCLCERVISKPGYDINYISFYNHII